MSDWTKEPWETCAFSDAKTEWGVHAPEHPDARKNDKEPPYHMEHAVTICRGMTGPAREANAERIASCVNACSGMADPAAEISRLRAALGERGKAIRDAMKWAGIGGLMREKVMTRLAALSAPVKEAT